MVEIFQGQGSKSLPSAKNMPHTKGNISMFNSVPAYIMYALILLIAERLLALNRFIQRAIPDPRSIDNRQAERWAKRTMVIIEISSSVLPVLVAWVFLGSEFLFSPGIIPTLTISTVMFIVSYLACLFIIGAMISFWKKENCKYNPTLPISRWNPRPCNDPSSLDQSTK